MGVNGWTISTEQRAVEGPMVQVRVCVRVGRRVASGSRCHSRLADSAHERGKKKQRR
jgi:hypothetical protein